MERYKFTPDQAFNLLSAASQHTGLKLRDVAQELVRTGTCRTVAEPRCSCPGTAGGSCRSAFRLRARS